ncbi:MAG: glycosyltransferase family 2 protein [Bdellovibrionales bacterium]
MSVSAIVVSYWTGPTLRDCLAALLAEPLISEVILVNNGNAYKTSHWLSELTLQDARIKVLTPQNNIGFSAGCNYGAWHTQNEYLAFINPDLILLPGSLDTILRELQSDPAIWICGARLLNPDGSEQRGGRRELLTPWRSFVELTRLDKLFPRHPYFRRFHQHEEEVITTPFDVPTISGAFMVMRRSVFRILGGFDDHMFMHVEDSDLCIRILQKGGRVRYCGNAPVRHFLSTSDAAKCFVNWHKTRSATYFFHKHFTGAYPSWALSLMAILLWCRFSVMLLRHGPSDILWAIGRLHRISKESRSTGATLSSAHSDEG